MRLKISGDVIMAVTVEKTMADILPRLFSYRFSNTKSYLPKKDIKDHQIFPPNKIHFNKVGYSWLE
jgi:hypothetical protein